MWGFTTTTLVLFLVMCCFTSTTPVVDASVFGFLRPSKRNLQRCGALLQQHLQYRPHLLLFRRGRGYYSSHETPSGLCFDTYYYVVEISIFAFMGGPKIGFYFNNKLCQLEMTPRGSVFDPPYISHLNCQKIRCKTNRYLYL